MLSCGTEAPRSSGRPDSPGHASNSTGLKSGNAVLGLLGPQCDDPRVGLGPEGIRPGAEGTGHSCRLLD